MSSYQVTIGTYLGAEIVDRIADISGSSLLCCHQYSHTVRTSHQLFRIRPTLY